jgi:hypothetical protein
LPPTRATSALPSVSSQRMTSACDAVCALGIGTKRDRVSENRRGTTSRTARAVQGPCMPLNGGRTPQYASCKMRPTPTKFGTGAQSCKRFQTLSRDRREAERSGGCRRLVSSGRGTTGISPKLTNRFHTERYHKLCCHYVRQNCLLEPGRPLGTEALLQAQHEASTHLFFHRPRDTWITRKDSTKSAT